jgi:hypothetical protein
MKESEDLQFPHRWTTQATKPADSIPPGDQWQATNL